MTVEARERLVIATQRERERRWCRGRLRKTELWHHRRASGRGRLEVRDLDEWGRPTSFRFIVFIGK